MYSLSQAIILGVAAPAVFFTKALFSKEECKALFEMISKLAEGFGGIYDVILNISIPDPAIDGITALGVSLTSLFFCMEMFSQLAQFRVERFEDAIRIGMKFVVAKVIIENTSGIAGGIKAIFMKASSTSLKDSLAQIAYELPEELFEMDAGFLNINFMLINMWGLVYLIVFFVIFVTILINIVGIVFEITIHQAVAPIALSTLCNDTVRQTGISFIKSYAATCLQIGVIGVVLSAFSVIFSKFNSLETVLNIAGDTSPLLYMLSTSLLPLIELIVLSKAIKTSGDLTKRMFGT